MYPCKPSNFSASDVQTAPSRPSDPRWELYKIIKCSVCLGHAHNQCSIHHNDMRLYNPIQTSLDVMGGRQAAEMSGRGEQRNESARGVWGRMAIGEWLLLMMPPDDLPQTGMSGRARRAARPCCIRQRAVGWAEPTRRELRPTAPFREVCQ